MNLGQLKNHIEDLPHGTRLKYSLSDPFSWRGSYDEVAFRIEEIESTREELLEKIERALTEIFTGWKGGRYSYHESTTVHFEEDESAYSAGAYVDRLILKIDGMPYISNEHKLVDLIF